MPHDRQKHRRRSIRLKGYNYAQPGAYSVTICAKHGEPLFGEIVDGRMHLNAAGEMVWRWWRELNHKFPSVRTDAAVVMPNHFHGIIVITGQPHAGNPDRGRPRRVAPTEVTLPVPGQPPGHDRPHAGADDASPTLGDIVGWLKTMTTNEYIRGVKQHGWPPFPGKLWQRNYYEHIIRNRAALERIRSYIETNPEWWALDRENPHRAGIDELESWLYRESAEQ